MKIGDLLNPEQYALDVLNGIEEVRGNLPDDGNDVEESLSMAKKALEKQIAKKVIYHDNCDNETPYQARCPECYEAIRKNDYLCKENWCPYCGQRIDWKVEE